ncbi:hypothetical protein TWF718_003542 [Orbilia javanica]|uniref:Uncharacterized protein n=1 Tax=Orbilia javanica TaxID=47235 RepID=A0AAN8NKW0_9PEZI
MVYIATIVAATFFHKTVIAETKAPYLLIALYQSITAVIALVYTAFNTYATGNFQALTQDTAMKHESIPEHALKHWKPFAYILLYLFSEEGFWLSLSSLSLFRQQLIYLSYPLFAAIFTWVWVISGRGGRPTDGIKGERMLKVAALAGLLVLCWSYELSFGWCISVVGVAMRGFMNVITRDLITSGDHIASELVMSASSALAFRALSSCYSSTEWARIWPHLAELSWEIYRKAIATGVCYGMAQLIGMEILRKWETAKGCWIMVVPAAVGVVGCLAMKI